jgi:hypothetical protein
LLQAKENRVDGIRRINRVAFCLVCVDEGDEDFQFVGITGSASRAPQAFDPAQCALPDGHRDVDGFAIMAGIVNSLRYQVGRPVGTSAR